MFISSDHMGMNLLYDKFLIVDSNVRIYLFGNNILCINFYPKHDCRPMSSKSKETF